MDILLLSHFGRQIDKLDAMVETLAAALITCVEMGREIVTMMETVSLGSVELITA